MAEKPRNGPGEPARSADGKVTGGSLRKASQLKNARGLSRKLRAEMKRRHGSAEALYFWLLDIAESPTEKASDRIKAIEQYGNRMDGKPLQALEMLLSGGDGGPIQVENPRNDLTAPDRLAAVVAVLRTSGALPSGGGTGDAGGGTPPT